MTQVEAPRSFRSAAALGRWLERHHASAPRLWVLLAKKHVPPPKLTYAQMVEEALCWGWVDGLAQPWDDDAFAIRLTPRSPRSRWSAPNVARVTALIASGRMKPQGLALVEVAKRSGAWTASAATPHGTVSPALKRLLAKHPKAQAALKALTPGRRRLILDWIGDAKSPQTHERRVARAVIGLEAGETFPFPMSRAGADAKPARATRRDSGRRPPSRPRD